MHLSKISLALRQWGAAGFSPLSLFASGEQGAWYDPSDLSTMFQDSAGTTPVTTDGQSVGKILDKSGHGNHASQATAAARPLYKTDGTYHWLQFDGVDDCLSTSAINFTSTNKMSVWTGHMMTGGGTYRSIVELSSDSAATNGSFGILGNGNVPYGNYIYFRGTSFFSGQAILPSAKIVLTTLYDIALSARETELSARANGATTTLTYAGSVSAGTGMFGTWPLFMGAKNGAASFFTGNIYSIIVRGALSTAQQTTDAEVWVNGKTGAY